MKKIWVVTSFTQGIELMPRKTPQSWNLSVTLFDSEPEAENFVKGKDTPHQVFELVASTKKAPLVYEIAKE